MGVARTAIELLPFGAEDDNRAWSRFGGRWRRVRYPRGWPPGWGKHPVFAVFLAVLWGAVAIGALYGLVRVAQWAAEADTTTDPTFTREQLDWIGRGALLVTIPFALVLLWALYLLVRAVPDLWLRARRTATSYAPAPDNRSSSRTATIRSTATTSPWMTGRGPGSGRGVCTASCTKHTRRARR
jgi:hypothetical protein